MSLAAGTQLFVEPQLLSQASNAVVPNDYSLNQLAYQYAFQQNDFNGAAAISLLLLVVALAAVRPCSSTPRRPLRDGLSHDDARQPPATLRERERFAAGAGDDRRGRRR